MFRLKKEKNMEKDLLVYQKTKTKKDKIVA